MPSSDHPRTTLEEIENGPRGRHDVRIGIREMEGTTAGTWQSNVHTPSQGILVGVSDSRMLRAIIHTLAEAAVQIERREREAEGLELQGPHNRTGEWDRTLERRAEAARAKRADSAEKNAGADAPHLFENGNDQEEDEG
jgi:hypothetical protein